MTQVLRRKTSRLILVRHTAVDTTYTGRCYGASDVALSDEGLKQAVTLADNLASHTPTRVFHSGLQRTKHLADKIGEMTDLMPLLDPRLAEMNFGAWEGETWDAIYESGQDIAQLLHAPDAFSAPGGETTFAMRDRMMAWFEEELPSDGVTIAVSHGGPIAALRGTLKGAGVERWPDLIPQTGTFLVFDGCSEIH